MNLQTTISTAIVVGAVVLLTPLIARIVGRRLNEQLRELLNQLVPVVLIAAVMVGLLVILDPDQVETLTDFTFDFVPKVIVAVLIIILTKTGGQIIGTLAEAALRGMSPIVAARVRLAVQGVLMGIGVIIALDTLGVSTNIILLLVAAVAFGAALAGGLAIGLGSLSLSRQVAAGRYVQDRFRPGQLLRIDGVEGRLKTIGLSSTLLEGSGGSIFEVPNESFLRGAVTVLPD